MVFSTPYYVCLSNTISFPLLVQVKMQQLKAASSKAVLWSFKMQGSPSPDIGAYKTPRRNVPVDDKVSLHASSSFPRKHVWRQPHLGPYTKWWTRLSFSERVVRLPYFMAFFYKYKRGGRAKFRLFSLRFPELGLSHARRSLRTNVIRAQQRNRGRYRTQGSFWNGL